MKPKIYNLYYSWYEEYSRNEFTHPQNKLLADFQKDCQDLLLKYAPDFMKNGGLRENRNFKTWIGACDFIELIASKLPELGYIKIEDTFDNISFGVFGSNILQERDGDEGIVHLLGNELAALTFAHNKYVEQRLDKMTEEISKKLAK